jgi:hypothetical protein
VGHNFLVPIQRWRCPVTLQVKSVVVAAAGVTVAGVFFPLWFGVPVMVVVGVWGLGMAVRRAEVVVDPGAGVLLFRVGLIARRIRLANVTAVQADGAKVSIARSDGGEISVYTWRKSPLDRWLRMPVVAGEVAHAISKAAAVAPQAEAARAAGAATAADSPGAGPEGALEGAKPAARSGPARARSRRPLAVILLACTGALAGGAAFLVRVHWPSPVMTALGAILAFVLGVSGVFYILFALWLLVSGPRVRRVGLRQEDVAVGEGDRLGGQRPGGRAGDDRAVGDLELAAVTGAVDRAVRDLVAEAPDVGADGAEGLVDARGRLGDDDLLVHEYLAATDRDVGHRAEQGARPGVPRCPGVPRRRGRIRRRGLRARRHAFLVRVVRDRGGAAPRQHPAGACYSDSQ